MNYIEFLRIVRGLRVVGIVLGLIFLAALIVRVSLAQHGTWDDEVHRITASSTAHVTTVKQADGSVKTIIDDPVQKSHAEIVDRGYAGKEILITQPSKKTGREHVVMGSVSVARESRNGMDNVHVMTNTNADLAWLFIGAVPMMLLFATLVAGPLAKENEGHLELAWTQPVSRTHYALTAIGLDLLGILLTAVATVIVYMLCASLFEAPHVVATAHSMQIVFLCVLASFGFYALVTAVSASMRRGPGLAIGLIWASVMILPGLAHIDGEPGTLGHGIGLVFKGLNSLNPLSYVPQTIHLIKDEPTLVGTAAWSPAILVALTVIYLAAALVQWRRVEA